uniref:Uncharacterized protein n=1 Tax=Rhizochromulina marina TaxID=1034831 RepID=A0A7S2R6A0_9STRA|mmetsp:Transcript_11632/g.33609  ORF Transcript_11632/g.33609 Transcript_11632/m.33609 type:complete len:480 (+) Transcript_11632:78-1517(+)
MSRSKASAPLEPPREPKVEEVEYAAATVRSLILFRSLELETIPITCLHRRSDHILYLMKLHRKHRSISGAEIQNLPPGIPSLHELKDMAISSLPDYEPAAEEEGNSESRAEGGGSIFGYILSPVATFLHKSACEASVETVTVMTMEALLEFACAVNLLDQTPAHIAATPRTSSGETLWSKRKIVNLIDMEDLGIESGFDAAKECLLVSQGPDGTPRVDLNRLDLWHAESYSQCLDLLIDGIIVLHHTELRVEDQEGNTFTRPTRSRKLLNYIPTEGVLRLENLPNLRTTSRIEMPLRDVHLISIGACTQVLSRSLTFLCEGKHRPDAKEHSKRCFSIITSTMAINIEVPPERLNWAEDRNLANRVARSLAMSILQLRDELVKEEDLDAEPEDPQVLVSPTMHNPTAAVPPMPSGGSETQVSSERGPEDDGPQDEAPPEEPSAEHGHTSEPEPEPGPHGLNPSVGSGSNEGHLPLSFDDL